MPGWDSGSTREWRKIRARVLQRDRYRCQLKLDGCKTIASHAHHLDGKAAGDNPDRIVAACPSCNLKTGNPAKGGYDPPPRARTAW